MDPLNLEKVEGLRATIETLIVRVIDANPDLEFPDVVARTASLLTNHARAGGAREELITAIGDYVICVGAVIAADLLPELLAS